MAETKKTKTAGSTARLVETLKAENERLTAENQSLRAECDDATDRLDDIEDIVMGDYHPDEEEDSRPITKLTESLVRALTDIDQKLETVLDKLGRT